MAAPPLVEATSQLSRFHLETLEITSSKAVQLNQVNLSIGDRQLLTDATLSLVPSVRSGLFGRNGVGKSTLLAALGTRRLVGFPAWLTCVHVEQEFVASTTDTCVETVLAADVRAQQMQREVELLEAALESCDPAQLAAAVTSIRAASAAASATAANAIATQRSGRRGVAARKAAVAAEQSAGAAASAAAAAASSEPGDAGGGMSAGEAATAASELLHARYESLAELDADAAEGRARQILTGLGFTKERMDGVTAALSGGWRTRLALARALYSAPDVLCLDEPTTHLDLRGIIWLQDYLTTSCANQTVLVVSHDRAFLNAVCQETIEMKDKQLRYFPGPYDAYQEAKAAAALAASRQAAALDKQKAHIQASIAAAEKQARQAGDDKKLGQAASRKKKLEERHGLDRNAAGRRFKLNRDLVGYHTSRRPQVELEKPDKPFDFSWPQPEPLRSAGAAGSLVQLHDVSFSYPGAAAPVLHGVTLNITGKSRIALLGNNGSGKSTLVKLLTGSLQPNPPPAGWSPAAAGPATPSPKQGAAAAAGGGLTKKQQKAARGLAVDAARLPSAQAAAAAAAAAVATGSSAAAGSIERAGGLRVGLFGQHSIEELSLMTESALERLTRLGFSSGSEQEARNFLGSFLPGGAYATQPLRSLSGGQKARVALAFLLVQRPHLLLLDEPTNFLDLDSVEAMGRAVRAYSGAVVVASHDLRFVQEVVEGVGGADGEAGSDAAAAAGEVWVLAGGRVMRWEKGVEAYAASLRKKNKSGGS